MNLEPLSEDAIIVEPQYVVQFKVGEGYSGMFVGLYYWNTNVRFNNHVMTLPSLETLMQGGLLEINLSVHGCDDNIVNSLEPVESLSLVHLELIDRTLQDQPIDIPTFTNDYTLAYRRGYQVS